MRQETIVRELYTFDSQNDYINSNERIDENITANEYEFTSEGKRA